MHMSQWHRSGILCQQTLWSIVWRAPVHCAWCRWSSMCACVPANDTEEKLGRAAVNQMPLHYLNSIYNQYGCQEPLRAHPEACGLATDVLIELLGYTSKSAYSSQNLFSEWQNRQTQVVLNLPFRKRDWLLLVMWWFNRAFPCLVIHWGWKTMKCSSGE